MELLLKTSPYSGSLESNSAEISRNNLNGIEKNLEALSSMPDPFNDLFTESGWIAYENLNSELMAKAADSAKRGNLVNDVSKSKGFFAEGTEMKAWTPSQRIIEDLANLVSISPRLLRLTPERRAGQGLRSPRSALDATEHRGTLKRARVIAGAGLLLRFFF